MSEKAKSTLPDLVSDKKQFPVSLFDPYKLKAVTLRNRIAVPPMCQYMAADGEMNEWHQIHYGSLARGGAGLIVVEATGVSPEGRITWADLGLWNDKQAEAMAPVVATMQKAGAVPGIQIAHAGRKASANRPWEGDNHIPEGQPNSWTTIGPSPIAFGNHLPRIPKEMTTEDIARVQKATVDAVARARDVGYQWMQMHFAHGYLAQNFFSPHSNQRTDQYGGSAENRARFIFETFVAVRKVWPENRPLAIRLGVAEFDGNDEVMLSESIDLLRRLKREGLDFVDVSVGFNTPTAKVPWGPNFLVPVAQKVRTITGLPVSTSWYTSKPEDLNRFICEGAMDLASVGRPMLSDPHWAYHAAQTLCLDNAAWKTLPPPYAHWLSRHL